MKTRRLVENLDLANDLCVRDQLLECIDDLGRLVCLLHRDSANEYMRTLGRQYMIKADIMRRSYRVGVPTYREDQKRMFFMTFTKEYREICKSLLKDILILCGSYDIDKMLRELNEEATEINKKIDEEWLEKAKARGCE